MLSGAPIQDFDKAWVNDYHFGLDLMEELLDATKSPPVDNFPILRWVPSIFAEWKRKAPRARKVLLNAHSSLMDQAKKERQGSFQALIPQLLRESKDPSTMPKERLSEHEIKMMMGGMLYVLLMLNTFQCILLPVLFGGIAINPSKMLFPTKYEIVARSTLITIISISSY